MYPGIGWLFFKDESVVPEELVFNVNYLGGNMPTYTLNFSRGSAMVVAQYYNFLRLGESGYRKIVKNMMQVASMLTKGLLDLDVFVLLGTRRMEPVVSVSLKKALAYSVYDISEALRAKGWIVPAYTLPENAEEIASLRIVVKENMSLTLAKEFLVAIKSVIKSLSTDKKAAAPATRKGKFMTH